MVGPLTRKSLLQKAVVGSEDAWEEITLLYHPMIKRWLSRNGLTIQDAEEIAQDVMCVVVRKIPTFQHSGRPGAFRAWIREISVNHIKGFWRKQSLRQPAIGGSAFLSRLDELSDPRSDLTEAWNAEHDDFILRCLLDKVLSNAQTNTAAIFRAAVIEEKPVDEVAKQYDTTVGAIYSVKSRIIRQLKDEASGLIDEIGYS